MALAAEKQHWKSSRTSRCQTKPRAKSYKPVAHYDLVTNIGRVAADMLHDYSFSKGMYALTKDGNRMFGINVFQRVEHSAKNRVNRGKKDGRKKRALKKPSRTPAPGTA